MLTEQKNVAIMIDHSNLKHTWQSIKNLNQHKKIDYLKLVQWLTHQDKALYKVVFLNRNIAGDKLCHFFDEEGFETIEKKPKQIIDYERHTAITKCNLDVDIAIVAMQMIFDRDLYPIKPDKIVIVTGDSDFEWLGHTIVSYKVEVQFVFLSQGFARELRENFPCKTLDNLPIWKSRFS